MIYSRPQLWQSGKQYDTPCEGKASVWRSKKQMWKIKRCSDGWVPEWGRMEWGDKQKCFNLICGLLMLFICPDHRLQNGLPQKSTSLASLTLSRKASLCGNLVISSMQMLLPCGNLVSQTITKAKMIVSLWEIGGCGMFNVKVLMNLYARKYFSKVCDTHLVENWGVSVIPSIADGQTNNTKSLTASTASTVTTSTTQPWFVQKFENNSPNHK